MENTKTDQQQNQSNYMCSAHYITQKDCIQQTLTKENTEQEKRTKRKLNSKVLLRLSSDIYGSSFLN